MTIILAADHDWAIGKDGELLTSIPEDMKFFRETTKGSTVVMGRKTWDSLPKKPLPDRVNCVLSRTMKSAEGAQVFGSVDELLKFTKNADGKVFVIGGAEIYNELLPHCDEAYITRIYENFHGDVFFEDIEHDKEWELLEASPVISSECRNIRFFHYKRK